YQHSDPLPLAGLPPPPADDGAGLRIPLPLTDEGGGLAGRPTPESLLNGRAIESLLNDGDVGYINM
ncbi:7925_t:CDS:2, partial [Acaulospora morrowiae]